MLKLICKKCRKEIKENTDGDLKYCQGHNLLTGRLYITKGTDDYGRKL